MESKLEKIEARQDGSKKGWMQNWVDTKQDEKGWTKGGLMLDQRMQGRRKQDRIINILCNYLTKNILFYSNQLLHHYYKSLTYPGNSVSTMFSNWSISCKIPGGSSGAGLLMIPLSSQVPISSSILMSYVWTSEDEILHNYFSLSK